MLLVVWDCIREKWLIAYFHLPTADLSRCDMLHLVHLEMLQNFHFQRFETADISIQKPKCLQVGENDKLLKKSSLFTAKSDFGF